MTSTTAGRSIIVSVGVLESNEDSNQYERFEVRSKEGLRQLLASQLMSLVSKVADTTDR